MVPKDWVWSSAEAERSWRRRRVRRGVAFGVLAAALVWLATVAIVAEFRWEPVTFHEVHSFETGGRETELYLGVDACNADTKVDRIVETEDEIRIALLARRAEPTDCADSHTVDLSAPVGDRMVVDVVGGRRFERVEPDSSTWDSVLIP